MHLPLFMCYVLMLGNLAVSTQQNIPLQMPQGLDVIQNTIPQTETKKNDTIFIDWLKHLIGQRRKSNTVKMNFKGDEKQETIQNEYETPIVINVTDYNEYPSGEILLLAETTTVNTTENGTTIDDDMFGKQFSVEVQTPEDRQEYIRTVSIPTFITLVLIAVVIFVIFHLPTSIFVMCKEPAFLSWNDYYADELKKHELLIDGGICLCEERIAELLNADDRKKRSRSRSRSTDRKEPLKSALKPT